MQIKINDKFKIISHDIGESFLVLNTSYFVKIYPGLLFFKDLNTDKNFKIFFNFQGPVKNFAILQNLHSGNIEVFFHTKEGYVAYKILVKKENVCLSFEKISVKEFSIKFDKIIEIASKQKIQLPIKIFTDKKPEEYLSFGIYKKPTLYQIKKRENLQEILPFIFLYSQFYLNVKYSCCLKEDCLLKEIDKKMQKKDRQNLCESFLKALKVHFFGSFIPRINDEEYQNISKYFNKEMNPWCIFIKFYQSIKEMFIKQRSKELVPLPCLPIEFHHGRAVNIKIPSGIIDIEWSKKILKKAIFKPLENVELKLVLQSKIKTFRLKVNKNEKGKICKNGDIVKFEKDKKYFLDNFKK